MRFIISEEYEPCLLLTLRIETGSDDIGGIMNFENETSFRLVKDVCKSLGNGWIEFLDMRITREITSSPTLQNHHHISNPFAQITFNNVINKNTRYS